MIIEIYSYYKLRDAFNLKKSIHNRINVASWMWKRKKRDDQMCATGVNYAIASYPSIILYAIPKRASQELGSSWRLSPSFKRLNTLNKRGQTYQQVISSKGKPVCSHMVSCKYPIHPPIFSHCDWVDIEVGCTENQGLRRSSFLSLLRSYVA